MPVSFLIIGKIPIPRNRRKREAFVLPPYLVNRLKYYYIYVLTKEPTIFTYKSSSFDLREAFIRYNCAGKSSLETSKYSLNKLNKRKDQNNAYKVLRSPNRSVGDFPWGNSRLGQIRVTEHDRSASESISTDLSRRKIKLLQSETVIGSIMSEPWSERDPSRPNQVTGS